MRSAASDRLAIAALAVLLAASIWLKDRVPPADAPPGGWLERTVAARLQAQGFAAGTQRLPHGTLLVEARRGDCRLAARDAAAVLGSESGFVQATRSVGPVTYLYGGRRSAAPPTLRLRLDKLRREAARLIGIRLPFRAAIALAAAPACGSASFALDDLRFAG